MQVLYAPSLILHHCSDDLACYYVLSDTVMAKYPGTSHREVRLWISEKASNAAKQLRKPLSGVISDNSMLPVGEGSLRTCS